MKKLAFLFPGQGAQHVGMCKDFYENFTTARETILEAEEILKFKISEIMFDGPQDILTTTKNSQVAIFVGSIAILRVLQEQFEGLRPTVCAGLSLGEYTALCASGRLSFVDSLKLVRCRAEYMNEACEENKGAMSVVIGLSSEEVEDMVLKARLPNDLWAANFNCPGQVVLSGTPKGIVIGTRLAEERNAKYVIPLQVHGAFHSGLMRSAQDRLEPKIREMILQDSEVDLISNVTGDYVRKEEEVKDCLIKQVVSSVRWEKGIHTMEASGVESYLEIGCGTVLSGLNKRIGVQAPTLNVEKIQDMESL
jgi:[acyl-carrier-protein] S-malonyltransferase